MPIRKQELQSVVVYSNHYRKDGTQEVAFLFTPPPKEVLQGIVKSAADAVKGNFNPQEYPDADHTAREILEKYIDLENERQGLLLLYPANKSRPRIEYIKNVLTDPFVKMPQGDTYSRTSGGITLFLGEKEAAERFSHLYRTTDE